MKKSILLCIYIRTSHFESSQPSLFSPFPWLKPPPSNYEEGDGIGKKMETKRKGKVKLTLRLVSFLRPSALDR